MKADIHSHILPEIDDGAKSLSETASLLRQLSENGIRSLAFTPHYYPSRQPLEEFLEKRAAAFEKAMNLPEAKEFSFSLGAEVYLSEALFNNTDLSALCYEGTNRMLVEIEYLNSFSESARYRLLRLREDYDVIPVLAHIDRYPFFRRGFEALSELRRMGCEFQVNLSSFCSYFGKRDALRFFDRGFLDYLGEDVHSECIAKSERKKMLEKISKKRKSLLLQADENAISNLFLNV